MASVTIPSTPGFKALKPVYRRSSAMSVSKYNFTQQVYSWKGKIKVVEFVLPPMTSAQADDWLDFLDQLDGHVNTFNVDLSKAYPNESGISSVEMCLVNPEQTWDIDALQHVGLSFVAMEVK